jgi:glycosyltransferase involved in cell wall biosynthesis
VNALGDKLIWLLSDGALRDRLAAQAQRDVYTRFGREQIIERIETLYMKILRGDKK